MCECASGCACMLAHVFGAMQNNRFFNIKAWTRQKPLPTSASNPIPASPLGQGLRVFRVWVYTSTEP